MNRLYEIILFIQTGIPPYAWTLHHNLGHHKHYLDPKLDPAAWQGKNGKVMNRIRYDVYNALRIYPEIIRIGQSRPKLLKRFYLWSSVSLLVLLALFLWKPLAVAIVIMLPMPIMLLGLMDNTYHQHQGLNMDSDYTASRNTSNRLYNLISWNLGYHTAHHSRPNVHWSELPKLHEQIKSRIPEDLICDSVFLSACGRKAGGQQPIRPLAVVKWANSRAGTPLRPAPTIKHQYT
jgi:fatty acid desaturase